MSNFQSLVFPLNCRLCNVACAPMRSIRRCLERKNAEVDQLEDQMKSLAQVSSKQGQEIADLHVELTSTADALKQTIEYNQEMRLVVEMHKEASERITQSILGRGPSAGTVGIKLQFSKPSISSGVKTGASRTSVIGQEAHADDARKTGGVFYVEALTEGGAAEQSRSVQEKDVVLSINGQDLNGLGLEEAEALLLGRSRSTVTIAGRRGVCGSEFMVTLTRMGAATLTTAAACCCIEEMRKNLTTFFDRISLDKGTRKQLCAWHFHVSRKRYHQALSRCFCLRHDRSRRQSLTCLSFGWMR